MKVKKFGCPFILLFPYAEVYNVGDVIDFISVAKSFTCEHYSSVPFRRPSVPSKWSSDDDKSFSEPLNNEHSQHTEVVPVISMSAAFAKLRSGDVCGKCAYDKEQTKRYLMERILNACNEKKIELWGSFGGKVRVPHARSFTPNLNDPFYKVQGDPQALYNSLKFWVRMGNIYKGDLIRFCEDEKICVEFEGGDAHMNENNADSPSRDDDIQRVPMVELKETLKSIHDVISKFAEALPTSSIAPDLPVAEVDGTISNLEVNETKDEKVDRLKKRKAELKKKGVRNFNQTLAKEENLSISRIKQLLNFSTNKPNNNWVGLKEGNNPKRTR